MSESAGRPKVTGPELDGIIGHWKTFPKPSNEYHAAELLESQQRELAECRAELEACTNALNAARLARDLAVSRLASHAEREGTYRLTEDEAKTLREGGTISAPIGTRFLLPPAPSAASGLEEEIMQAAARGYGATANLHKELDADLLKAIVKEIMQSLRSRPAQGVADTKRLDWLDANPRTILRSGKQHIRPLIDAAMSQQEGK